jgi:pyruvate dehydrogenase E1 component beta subunit
MAAGWGQLAATHSQTFENYFAYVPGLKVVMPSTPYDAKGLLKEAIRDPDPVLFIEHALLYSMRGEVPDREFTVPIGVADVKREGQDVTVVAWSRMACVAMQAAERLADRGVDVEVVDPRTLRPLDLNPLVRSVQKTNRCLVVEEGWRSAGMGAEVAASIQEAAFDYLDAPVQRLASAEVPMPYARNLELEVIPDVEDVVRAIEALAA